MFELIMLAIPFLIDGKRKAKKNPSVKLPSFLTNEQKINAKRIIVAFGKFGDEDPNKLAYILATALYESGLMPIEEIKADPSKNPSLYARQKRYWGSGYYGRGFVQLTWPENYRKMSQIAGVDLLRNPNLALDPNIASNIIVAGMMDGTFTGKKLSDFIEKGKKPDFFNARRTVNILDKADRIKSTTHKFLS